MVLFGQKLVVFWLNGCIQANWLYLGNSGFIRAKVVVFEQKWLYSGKSCYNREKMVELGQKWL